MNTSAMYIQMKGMQFYAFHGVDPQETEVGSYFSLDLKLKTDFSHASESDNLTDTVSYADIYAAVKDEMKTPSLLLEHVAYRIANRIFQDFPTIESIELGLYKENPPMGACAQNIGVEIHYQR